LGAAEAVATILPASTNAEPVNVHGTVAGRSTAVSASNQLALVGAGTTLEVMARLPDGMPSRIGGLRLPGMIEAVAMADGYAFVACGPKGLQVVDLANPSQPTLVASVPLPGHAYDVQAAGQIVCVAAGQAGLRIFDVTQPMAPTPVGSFLSGGPVRAVALAGQTALVLDAHAGLLVLDLSTPSAPLLKGAQPAIYAGTDVAVAGQTALATDARGFFWVVSLANPGAPEVTSRISMPGLGHGIGVAPSGGHVYVASDTIGVMTAELTGGGARWIATNTLSGNALDLAVNGSSMYVAAGFAGLETWSLANPPVPSPAAVVPIGLRAVQPVIAGSLAYVAAGEMGLHIYSLADAIRPRLVGSMKGLMNARAVAVQRDLAVVADGPCGVRIIDVSNPAAPQLLGTFTNTSPLWIRAVTLSGQRVAATDGTTLSLIDVSNPAAPFSLDQVKLNGYAFALAMDPGWLAVSAGATGLQFYNTTGDRLELANIYPTPGPATDIARSGKTACVACGPAGWLLLDISDPGSPQPIKLIPSTGLASSAAVSRTLVFMANSTGTVISVENSAPLNPLAENAFGPMVHALAVAASDRMALVAEDDAGMAVLAPALAEPYALAMFNIVSESDRTVTVQWRSEQGKTYTLHRSFDLRDGFVPIARGLAATPPLNTFSDTVTAEVAFYMVSIE
ncbi:MAG: LVIVD repeat-containing protein, partial [Verrucomicrobiia bacterium]